MTTMLKDLKDSCLYKEDHNCVCNSCGNIIKNHAAKRFPFNYGAGGTLCMTCLFKLHLELNDLFEDTPIGLESSNWNVNRY